MLDEQAWMEYLNIDDPAILRSLDVFDRDASFPELPKEEQQKKSKKVAINSNAYYDKNIYKTNLMKA